MPRPSNAPIRKQVGLPAETAERVEAFRFDNRRASESEAIREKIELGLEVTKERRAALRRVLDLLESGTMHSSTSSKVDRAKMEDSTAETISTFREMVAELDRVAEVYERQR